MLSDLRQYKEGKEQKDCDDMMSESVSSKMQKNWPRKDSRPMNMKKSNQQ